MSKEIEKVTKEGKKPVRKAPTRKQTTEEAPFLERVSLGDMAIKREYRDIEVGGIKFKLLTYMPPEERMQLADTISNASVIMDEESGRAYRSALGEMYACLYLVYGYTNLDIDFSRALETYDYLYENGVIDTVLMESDRGYASVIRVADSITETVIEYYNATHSMDYYMRQMSNGNQVGEELLGIIEQTASNASVTAGKIDEAMKKAAPSSIISFAKRKKE